MTITIMDLPTEEEEKILIEELRKTFDVSTPHDYSSSKFKILTNIFRKA